MTKTEQVVGQPELQLLFDKAAHECIVCRLPFTKPEILPDLKRFTEEMASSSSLVAIMSIF